VITTSGVSVVCPVFCSEQTLEILVNEIRIVLEKLEPYEVILVDDGSTDCSWAEIQRLAANDPRVKGLRLGKNVGQHSALLAGVRYASFGSVVTLDDDLQNPPSEIPKLLTRLRRDGGVVYGTSLIVEQFWWRRLSSQIAKKLFKRFLGFNSAIKISSFRAFYTELRNGFEGDLGPNVSLDSLLTWSTANFSTIEVAHHTRRSGSSNYTLRKLIRFMIDTATGYSAIPLRFATKIGFFVTLFGFVLFLWVTIRPLILGNSVPGFPLLASSLAIFSGTQLLMLGILGEYIGKIHFRTMKQPTYTISDKTS
jgi:undecaprenyl-phosphate 4-deoxy-4-formamido-L-arabinose transferase